MGSNMAECHPVGFQWVMEAKRRGATVIHVDPRFTRTSAAASAYVPIRPGADIAFLGGLINHVVQHERDFREYVVAYTNAPAIVGPDFRDSEDLDGLFSGWDPQKGRYDTASWQYEGGQDPTLQHPRCVYQILKRHFARYTPEMVAETCGCTVEQFLRVAEALCANSGRERTSAVCYAVGWTQHTVGVQIIRAAAILQLLLGNIGRPGGGILALRGHASIQGSTDIPTLYNLLPGYIPMPRAHEGLGLQDFVRRYAAPTGGWGGMEAYLVSLLKAYWGERATAENEFGWRYLPRIDEDNSAYRSALAMLDGQVQGFIVAGENPAVGSANAKLHRHALARLRWLVVRDLVETETAAFWCSSPEIESGELRTEDIETEVFFLPAAAHTEKDGSFTNTQRLLQWHHRAVEPRGDARSDLWFYFHLGRLIREKLKRSRALRDRPILHLRWDYPTHGPHLEPDAEAVLMEINGRGPDGRPISSFRELRADGSTACGCWIYAGCYAEGVNQTARRRPGSQQEWVAPEWGWAWPANRRLLYNRASAQPDGKPWSERKRYVWWDAEHRRWTGHDTPDFAADKPPDYRPPEGAGADAALSGDSPFVMQRDGKGWLFAPLGLVDGPLPVHFEPHESPVANPLYRVQSNPARQSFPRPLNPDNAGAGRYPFVAMTYRLTEHHTAGGMSRTVPVLAELQPEMFCEVSPELARERGLTDGGWALVSTARATIETRVLVTERIPALTVRGARVHVVGLPYHWGTQGLTTGDAANDLFPIVLDPNVHIQEVKAATCDIRPGRRQRPRGVVPSPLVAEGQGGGPDRG